MSELTDDYRNFLTTKYNVLGGVHLIRYDSDFEKIETILSTLKKDCHPPADRIVIEHFDTDYYLPEFPYGFTLHNLFTAFRKVDLPLFTMLLITNHFGIKREVEKLITDPNDCPTIVETFISSYHYTNYYQDIKVDADEIVMPGVCMMGTKRVHRHAFYRYAESNNLLDYIAIKY
jgi:hypothetical protein